MPKGYSKKTGENPFKGKKREPFSEEHRLNISISGIGRIPWNKGLTNLPKHSDATKMKMSESHSDEKHPGWKGDNVSYSALHAWISRKKGAAKNYKCSKCGKGGRMHWANKDHKYRRILKDWIVLCSFCHRRYDYKNKIKKTLYAKT